LGSGANSCIALEVTTFPVMAAVLATTAGGIGGSCAPLDSLLLIFSGVFGTTMMNYYQIRPGAEDVRVACGW